MRYLISTALTTFMTVCPILVTGCESDPAAMEAERLRPTLDMEHGGGMNRTGAGSSSGSSSSGMDRAGGGFSGSHGGNSGETGRESEWSQPAGPGGAPAPGR